MKNFISALSISLILLFSCSPNNPDASFIGTWTVSKDAPLADLFQEQNQSPMLDEDLFIGIIINTEITFEKDSRFIAKGMGRVCKGSFKVDENKNTMTLHYESIEPRIESYSMPEPEELQLEGKHLIVESNSIKVPFSKN